MTQTRDRLMHMLYGSDIWADWLPTRGAEVVRGWNGRHPALARIATASNPAVIADIGVWKGQSTIFLAQQLKTGNIDGCILAVDTFLGSMEHWGVDAIARNETWSFDRQVGFPDLYEQFIANVWHGGLTDYIIPIPQTSITAARILRRYKVPLGMVHLDASHDYTDVAQDISEYWTLLAPGGYLVGDDYNWQGVRRAVDEFQGRTRASLEIEMPKWIIRKSG